MAFGIRADNLTRPAPGFLMTDTHKGDTMP